MGQVIVFFVIGGAMTYTTQHLLRDLGVAPTAARIRGGLSALPTSVTDIAPCDEPAIETVDAFIDALAALPFEQWLNVGRALQNPATARPTRSTARAILEGVMAEQGQLVSAWYVRDGVDTAVFPATTVAASGTRPHRLLVAAAHGAAEEAALALMVGATLPAIDFDVLYAPFIQVIPVSAGRALRGER
jgi:hypothetical protein